jgi:regulator of replication initiation timing
MKTPLRSKSISEKSSTILRRKKIIQEKIAQLQETINQLNSDKMDLLLENEALHHEVYILRRKLSLLEEK